MAVITLVCLYCLQCFGCDFSAKNSDSDNKWFIKKYSSWDFPLEKQKHSHLVPDYETKHSLFFNLVGGTKCKKCICWPSCWSVNYYNLLFVTITNFKGGEYCRWCDLLRPQSGPLNPRKQWHFPATQSPFPKQLLGQSSIESAREQSGAFMLWNTTFNPLIFSGLISSSCAPTVIKPRL